MYFFRVSLQDATGSIDVGFARTVASSLLLDLDASKFHQIFKCATDFEEFLHEKIYGRNVKCTIKRKSELFKDQIVKRNYAIDVELIEKEDTPAKLVETNKNLINVIDSLKE
jgi:hypothetical protein